MSRLQTHDRQDDGSNYHHERLQSVCVDHSSETTWNHHGNTSKPQRKYGKVSACLEVLFFFALWFTCDSVEGGNHQHEDRGQVQVPAQTHLDEQGPGVEVRLGREQGDIRRESRDGISSTGDGGAEEECPTEILVKTDSSSERTARYVLILSPPKRRPRYSGMVTI